MTPRFLIDRGTATISAGLVAHVDRRWRLLAAASFPASVDVEACLGYVADRAAEAFAGVPGVAEGLAEGLADWRSCERIEAVSVAPRRIAVLAPNARRAAELEIAAAQAGWHVAARVSPERDDAVDASTALADLELDAMLLGAGDPPRSDERAALADLAAIAGAIVERRPELITILSGTAAEEFERFPRQRVIFAPAPQSAGTAVWGNELARLLVDLGDQVRGARLAAARSTATLATVLERTVEAVDVGASGGAWFRAVPQDRVIDVETRDAETPDPEATEDEQAAHDETPAWTDGLDGFLLAAGAMVPERAIDDEADLDAVIAWSPLRIDRPTHRDRLRDLRAHPWQDAVGEGALLRMAAGRAALARMEEERERFGGAPAERMPAPDLLVVAGGAFALAPGSATALAAADTIRRPGMTQVAYDHARLLAPLGMLDEAERRVLIADLADQLLLPLGSVLVLTGGRPGREMGRLHVTSDWASGEVQPLSAGMLRVVELPPGAPADVELEVRDGRFGRTRAKRIGFEATGGLGGLLVDTRGVPLRLPQRSERRRDVLAQWQRSLWPGAE